MNREKQYDIQNRYQEDCDGCLIARGQDGVPYIYQDELWTVNLLLGSPPPAPIFGWAVLQPRRHIHTVAQFNLAESTSFGRLLQRCEQAMQEVLGVPKMYINLFAEDPTFHLHVHLIPRYSDWPQELVGPAVFNIDRDRYSASSQTEYNELQQRLAAVLEE